MGISSTVWAVTVVAVFAVYVLDFVVASRRPHEVSMREAGIWVGVYVTAALAFGAWVGASYGREYSAQFLAGWLTEYSLSIDNLFVFVIIMTNFAVPRLYQQKVLQIGIIGALILRFAFILVGAAALAAFSWLFFVFGAFLIWTAVKLARGHGESDPAHNPLLARLERVMPLTKQYHEGRFTVHVQGRRVFTPLAVVMVSIFLTDLLFALDSIPAIFGLTSEAYLVFTANAFALMGLRQLYFLLDGLLDRLVYLSKGLAVVLGFIGVKLVLHAMHESGLDVPEISIALSLAVIVVTMTVTVVWSLLAVRRHPELLEQAHTGGPDHHAGEGLEGIAQAHPTDLVEGPADEEDDDPT